jgi:hypothetical protein
MEELLEAFSGVRVTDLRDITTGEDFKVFVSSYFKQLWGTLYTEEFTEEAYQSNPPMFDRAYIPFCNEYNVELDNWCKTMVNEIARETFFRVVLKK